MRSLDGTMRSLTANSGATAWQPEDTDDTRFSRIDQPPCAAEADGRNRVETA